MEPEFITFTGVDDYTDINEMRRLSAEYPIEWGVLFSPDNQGNASRFPSVETLSRLAASGLRLAAHLCGGHSKAIMAGRAISPPVDLGIFARIQINHSSPDPKAISAYQAKSGAGCIAQARGTEFPESANFEWLFDTSGGRGVEPGSWPKHPGYRVGYAGGIGPDNVAAVIAAINSCGPYWIDMESKVRTNGVFDLNLCRQVCETVFQAAELRQGSSTDHPLKMGTSTACGAGTAPERATKAVNAHTDKERVTGVAILDDVGRLWALPAPSHHRHIVSMAEFLSIPMRYSASSECFTTSSGRTVDRSEARALVISSNQATRRSPLPNYISSLDLW